MRRPLSATAFSMTKSSAPAFLGMLQPRETWQGSARSCIGARHCRASSPAPRPLRPQKSRAGEQGERGQLSQLGGQGPQRTQTGFAQEWGHTVQEELSLSTGSAS